MWGGPVPDWLFEGLWQVYAVLGLAALGLLVLWWRDRRRGWLYGLGVVAALILLYLLLDFAVETDGEQINRELQEISQAVRNHDLNTAMSFVADDFKYEGKNKKELQALAAGYFHQGALEDLIIWDYRFRGKTKDTPPLANVTFRVKPKGNIGLNEALFFECEAQFDLDSKKVWRLKTMRLFDPAHENTPITPSDWGGRW
jgi:hypothetical protein